MKKVKNLFLFVFLACLAVCSIFLINNGFNSSFAAVNDNINIVGASVRLFNKTDVEDQSGIRFTVTVSSDIFTNISNAEGTGYKDGFNFGVLLCPVDKLPDGFDAANAMNYYGNGSKLYNANVDYDRWSDGGDVYSGKKVAHICLFNLPTTAYNWDIEIVAYYFNGSYYTYSNPLVRSMSQVAYAYIEEKSEIYSDMSDEEKNSEYGLELKNFIDIADSYLLNYNLSFNINGNVYNCVAKWGQTISEVIGVPDKFVCWNNNGELCGMDQKIKKAVNYVAEIYDYSTSASGFGNDFICLNLGEEYANKKNVSLSMKVCGNTSVYGDYGIGLRASSTTDYDDSHLGYYSINKQYFDDYTWHDADITIPKVFSDGRVYISASRTDNVGSVNSSFTAFIKDITPSDSETVVKNQNAVYKHTGFKVSSADYLNVGDTVNVTFKIKVDYDLTNKGFWAMKGTATTSPRTVIDLASLTQNQWCEVTLEDACVTTGQQFKDHMLAIGFAASDFDFSNINLSEKGIYILNYSQVAGGTVSVKDVRIQSSSEKYSYTSVSSGSWNATGTVIPFNGASAGSTYSVSFKLNVSNNTSTGYIVTWSSANVRTENYVVSGNTSGWVDVTFNTVYCTTGANAKVWSANEFTYSNFPNTADADVGVFIWSFWLDGGATVSIKDVVINGTPISDSGVEPIYDYDVSLNSVTYDIVVPASEYNNASSPIKYAAQILKNSLYSCGINVNIISDATKADFDHREIIIGQVNRSLSSKYAYDTLNNEEFRLINENGNLVVLSNSPRGYLYAIYQWLESVGYLFMTKDYTHIPSSSYVKVINDLNFRSVETPFKYRELMYAPDACSGSGDLSTVDWAVANAVNGSFWRAAMKNNAKYGSYEGYIGGDSYFDHNVVGWLLPIDYASTNPEYFGYRYYNDAYDCQVWTEYLGSYSEANLQPCLSNSSVRSIVKSYLSTRINNAINEALDNGTDFPHTVSVCAMDNWNYCHCNKCEQLYATYGLTGAWLRFVNDIADFVKENYGDLITVNTFSYGWTHELPLTKAQSDGHYVDDDHTLNATYTVVPRSNISIQICTTMCPFHTDPTVCSKLKTEEDRIIEWEKIADSIYIWYYGTDFSNYYAVWPNFDAIWYDFNFFANHSVKGIFCECNGKITGEFSELRSFLIARIMKNPNMDKATYDYLKNVFIEYYYGAASEYIKAYINYSKIMVESYYSSYGHTALLPNYEEDDYYITLTDYYLDVVDGYWVSALSAVSGNNTYYSRVEKSKLHWDYTKFYYRYDHYNCSTKDLYDKLVEYGAVYPNDIDQITGNGGSWYRSTKRWGYALING